MIEIYKALEKAVEISEEKANLGKTVAVATDTLDVIALERNHKKALSLAKSARPDGNYVTHVKPKASPLFFF